MIADDDEGLRRLVQLALEGQGFRILQAANGADVMALAPEEPPDVLLLDVCDARNRRDSCVRGAEERSRHRGDQSSHGHGDD
jgi:DNA-binding response OmpR family regulator